jgi:hypothetical protein
MLRRMGVDVSTLHLLVPAAEEIDLLELHHGEVLQREYGDLCDEADRIWSDERCRPDVDESAAEAGEGHEGWTLNHPSALAYVLRELGGQVDGED